MNRGERNIQYSTPQNCHYERLFQIIQHNGAALNETDRASLVSSIDEDIAHYHKGMQMISCELAKIKELDNDHIKINRTIYSVSLFLTVTMADCMVASKYFLIANKDYDRCFMRGKLMVILNEGFKQLYGFGGKNQKKTEWDKLASVINHFSEDIKLQYKQLSSLLEQHAHSCSWWKDERNDETHLDAEKLYVSRCEEIVESKTLIDSLKLFNPLLAVEHLLLNMCYEIPNEHPTL